MSQHTETLTAEGLTARFDHSGCAGLSIHGSARRGRKAVVSRIGSRVLLFCVYEDRECDQSSVLMSRGSSIV